MDISLLSRLQFAVATGFHFLFVPLTLGLSILIALWETLYIRTGDEMYRSMAKFWGKLFLINFAVGVVTGITLEFQFGTNWSKYSSYVGDIFGSLLAIEATLAFFLESTFIAVWFFGWNRLSPKLHLVTIWLVALASNISAYWILVANAWMQHPVGFAIRNGRAELTDFMAVITQKFAILELIHTNSSAYVLSGIFVMGVSSYHILRRQKLEFFVRSFRLAAIFSFLFIITTVFIGHLSGSEVAQVQPAKLAAMESHWDTGEKVPIHLILWPDSKNEENRIQLLPIPSALSILAHHHPGAEVTGLNDIPPEERPPVLITFLSFRIMVGLGFFFLLLAFWGVIRRNRLPDSPRLLKTALLSIPLPYLAIQLGWIVAEVGRQPWIVYNLMKTREAVSPINSSQVAVSLVAFILLYSLIGLTGGFLMFLHARRGPMLSEAEDGGRHA